MSRQLPSPPLKKLLDPVIFPRSPPPAVFFLIAGVLKIPTVPCSGDFAHSPPSQTPDLTVNFFLFCSLFIGSDARIDGRRHTQAGIRVGPPPLSHSELKGPGHASTLKR